VPSQILLEVIVQSVADAIAATEGGADRLEVVRDILQGGLTPAPLLVRAISAATPLPLRVMVRENAGYELGPGELPLLRNAAAEFAAIGADGIVLGFARSGQPSLEDVEAVLDGLAPVSVTFHRAFDSLMDPLGTIPKLTALRNVDRILTGGGDGTPVERCRRLLSYSEAAGSRLTIIAGGGVDDEALALFTREGCTREIHVGRAAREDGNPDGPVSAERVRRLRRLGIDH
jgi:copper homeostasis protein CutC